MARFLHPDLRFAQSVWARLPIFANSVTHFSHYVWSLDYFHPTIREINREPELGQEAMQGASKESERAKTTQEGQKQCGGDGNQPGNTTASRALQ